MARKWNTVKPESFAAFKFRAFENAAVSRPLSFAHCHKIYFWGSQQIIFKKAYVWFKGLRLSMRSLSCNIDQPRKSRNLTKARAWRGPLRTRGLWWYSDFPRGLSVLPTVAELTSLKPDYKLGLTKTTSLISVNYDVTLITLFVAVLFIMRSQYITHVLWIRRS